MLMMMTMLQMCFSRPVFCFRSIIINGEDEGTGSRETEDEKDENCLGSFVNCLYERRDERTQKSTGNILEQFLKRTQTTQIHKKNWENSTTSIKLFWKFRPIIWVLTLKFRTLSCSIENHHLDSFFIINDKELLTLLGLKADSSICPDFFQEVPCGEATNYHVP